MKFESETLETTGVYEKVCRRYGKCGWLTGNRGSRNGWKLTARLWKVTYENGEEVSREVINNSTYQTSDVTVKVGTKSDNARGN